MVAMSDNPLDSASLKDFLDIYDDEPFAGSPNNFWPEDRVWMVWSDYDLWATRVDGCEELIDVLVADEELKTARADPLFGEPPKPVRATSDGLTRIKDLG
jgi:hypothetical protein